MNTKEQCVCSNWQHSGIPICTSESGSTCDKHVPIALNTSQLQNKTKHKFTIQYIRSDCG